jgi:hypothetical protein
MHVTYAFTIALCALLTFVNAQWYSLIASDENNIYRVHRVDDIHYNFLVSVFDLSTLSVKSSRTVLIPSFGDEFGNAIIDSSSTYMYYIWQMNLVQLNLKTLETQSKILESYDQILFADDTFVYIDQFPLPHTLLRFKHTDLKKQSIPLPPLVDDFMIDFIGYSAQAGKAFFRSSANSVITLNTSTFSFTSSFPNSKDDFFGVSRDGSRLFGINTDAASRPDVFINVFDEEGSLINATKVGELSTDEFQRLDVAVDSRLSVDTFYTFTYPYGNPTYGPETLIGKIVGQSLVHQHLSYGNLTLPDTDFTEDDICPYKEFTGIRAANGYIYYEVLATDGDCENIITDILYSCNSNTGLCNSVDLLNIPTPNPTVVQTPAPITQESTPVPSLTSTSTPSLAPTNRLTTTAIPTKKQTPTPSVSTSSPSNGQNQSGDNNAKMASGSIQIISASILVLAAVFTLML